MSDKSPLIVPIQVYALVVNDQPQNFRRWSMNYRAADYFLSPEAEPFNANQNDFKATSNQLPNTANEGVYLQWMLPEALRHGTQNPDGGISFPLVPNRWLVVRYLMSQDTPTEREAVAWVIESDYLDPQQGANPFIDPTIAPGIDSTTYTPVYTRTLLGRKLSLSNQSWQETNAEASFLQAVAPANLMFASYQPHAQNVFSMHDDLAAQNLSTGYLSYMVVGWYSDAANDPLSASHVGDQTFAEAMSALQWIAENDADQTAETTLYHGTVMSIDWDQHGPLPTSPRDDVSPSVSIANTSIDAFTAWLEVNYSSLAGSNPDIDIQWLEAMQYNLLQEYSEPGGAAVLDQSIHNAWFGSMMGGTQWTLVSENLSANEDPPPPLSQAEMDWLDQLNLNEHTLEQTRWQLYAVQQQLYEMWWKNGYAAGYAGIFDAYPYNFTADDFAAQLNPQNNAAPSLTVQVHTLMQQIAQLAALVPTPTAGQTMDDAIAAFTQAAIASGAIADTRVLKALAKPSFYQASDPVILINGVNHNLNIDPYAALPCRYADQIVTGVEIDYPGTGTMLTASQVKNYLPTCANLSSVAAVINALLIDKSLVPNGDLLTALLCEFFLLDPSNAGIIAQRVYGTTSQSVRNDIASAIINIKPQVDAQLQQDQSQSVVQGVLPGFYEPLWSQPWLPLFIEWEAYWYPIPFAANGAPNWTFNGTDYAWTQMPGPLPEPQVITGRSLLTPKTAFDMKSRLEQYVTNNPDDETLRELADAITSINGWDFLSQTLTGFSAQVAQRDAMSNLAPDNTQALFSEQVAGINQTVDLTMADLVGDHHHFVPQSLMLKYPASDPLPASTFEGMRNGQFFFRRITLVDQFGQTIEVVTSSTSDAFYPILAPGVIPDQAITSVEPDRFVQLPPRLLQAARLNFNSVSPTDDATELFLNSDINPICGWLLPNHLDGGLAIYAPNGDSLGELQPATSQAGTKFVVWQAAPDAAYQSLQQIAAAYPNLGNVLLALQRQSYADFMKFLAAIDETLWMIDPMSERYDQHLSTLIGRPLALLRARLQFELQQNPIWDPAWPFTFNPPTPPFVAYEFPVRLGDRDHYQDGLLGYFAGNDYTVFNAVHDPNPGASAFLQKIDNGNFINLKFDGNTSAMATMLVDPRASVYAETAILPTAAITLEPRYVDAAMANIEVTFRTGPQLVTISTAVAQPPAIDDTLAMLMPTPAAQKGQWSWQERQGSEWPEMAIASINEAANLSSVMPTLREGLLKLRRKTTEEN